MLFLHILPFAFFSHLWYTAQNFCRIFIIIYRDEILLWKLWIFWKITDNGIYKCLKKFSKSLDCRWFIYLNLSGLGLVATNNHAKCHLLFFMILCNSRIGIETQREEYRALVVVPANMLPSMETDTFLLLGRYWELHDKDQPRRLFFRCTWVMP